MTDANKDSTPIKDQPDTLPEAEHDENPDAAPSIDGKEDGDVPEKFRVEDGVAAAKAEAEKNMEGWQRTLAEFQNYKRRVEREQKEASQRIALETLAKMLPIIDDFERALANMPEEFKDNPWMNGVSLIQGKFNKLLEEYSVEILDPTGQDFDPNHHQAISMEDSDEHESGKVIETLLKGYVSENTLLRPAMVRVAN